MTSTFEGQSVHLSSRQWFSLIYSGKWFLGHCLVHVRDPPNMTLHSLRFKRKVTYESLDNSCRSGTPPPPPGHWVIEFTTPHLITFYASRKALCRGEGLRWRSPAPQAAVLRTQIECLDLNSRYFCVVWSRQLYSLKSHRTLTTVGSKELWSFLFA